MLRARKMPKLKPLKNKEGRIICQICGKEIDYKEKRLGIVIRIKVNNKDMFWLHGIGTKYELNSGYAYLKNNSEWNKYDLSNKENMEKIRNYLNEKFSSGPCDKLNEGLEKSLDSLLYKESTK